MCAIRCFTDDRRPRGPLPALPPVSHARRPQRESPRLLVLSRRGARATFPARVGATVGAILLGLWLGARHLLKLANHVYDWSKPVANTRKQQAIAADHFKLGNALKDEGKFEAAIKAYRDAIRFNPDFAEAHFRLAVALQYQGRLDEAITELRTALRTDPRLAEAHFTPRHRPIRPG